MYSGEEALAQATMDFYEVTEASAESEAALAEVCVYTVLRTAGWVRGSVSDFARLSVYGACIGGLRVGSADRRGVRLSACSFAS